MTKIIMPISIDSELGNWVRNDKKNVSEFVSSLIEEQYKNRSDPIPKILKLEESIYKNKEKLEFFYDKLLKVIENGNKIEREKAEKVMEQRDINDIEEKNKFKELLDKLRKLPIWEEFVDSFEEMDIKEIGNWYEENILSKDLKLHRDIGGIGVLVRLTKKLTKEQLKGGLII